MRASCAVSWSVLPLCLLVRGGARGDELESRALREGLDAHGREHRVGESKLRAGVDTPTLPAQPFTVEEMTPCQLGPKRCGAEMLDRLLIESFGASAVVEQRLWSGRRCRAPNRCRSPRRSRRSAPGLRQRGSDRSSRTAASTSSTIAQTDTNRSGQASHASCAASTCLLVATETVAEHGRRPVLELESQSVTIGGGPDAGGLERGEGLARRDRARRRGACPRTARSGCRSPR